ncbi:hypothetical protein H5410_015192 [Solanum commersonii]|uniref:Uncharacterized protein n=1 Tax=Solanum commersonii TaxID=4109 RepID=A0A9J5ZT57_SOLCO|nr:hypothetical protein H5410_015192 [Solanum commersonii]
MKCFDYGDVGSLLPTTLRENDPRTCFKYLGVTHARCAPSSNPRHARLRARSGDQRTLVRKAPRNTKIDSPPLEPHSRSIAFERVASSRALITTKFRRCTHGARKTMYDQTLSVGQRGWCPYKNFSLPPTPLQ